MSQENVELVRRGFELFMSTGEILWDTIDEALEVQDHDIPDSRAYLGHEGFSRWLRDWGEAWSEWSMTMDELIDAEERVVVVVHMKAKGLGSGVAVDRHDSLVYGFRDGKIARIDYFNSREQGLNAAGLT
jgi:ketosteroid isomerase-like protein